MRDAGHRTPDAGHRTSDGEKSKNNISTPQGGGHNKTEVGYWSVILRRFLSNLGFLRRGGDICSFETLWEAPFSE